MSKVGKCWIFQHFTILLSYLRYTQISIFSLVYYIQGPVLWITFCARSQDEFHYLIKHSACSISLLVSFET